jgi:hypothetical protein
MATAQLKPIAKDFYLDTALATLIRIISADRIGCASMATLRISQQSILSFRRISEQR